MEAIVIVPAPIPGSTRWLGDPGERLQRGTAISQRSERGAGVQVIAEVGLTAVAEVIISRRRIINSHEMVVSDAVLDLVCMVSPGQGVGRARSSRLHNRYLCTCCRIYGVTAILRVMGVLVG